jgi:chromosome segregation ATPase
MSNSKALEEAAARLTKALQAFEQAVARRLEDDQSIEDLEQHIRDLNAEQERLMASLTDARQRAERLESVNDEVSGRLETVIDSIKTILKPG